MENNFKTNENLNCIIEDDVDLLLNIIEHKLSHKIDTGSQERFSQKDTGSLFLTKDRKSVV